MTQPSEARDILYQSLLQEYVAGTLDGAHRLVVSSHIQLSPFARALIYDYEALACAMIDKYCQPVPMADKALSRVLHKLDDKQRHRSKADSAYTPCADGDLPDSLRERLGCSPQEIRWKRLFKGAKRYRVPLECRSSKAEMMRMAPATRTPEHSHRGLEVTLVLQGAFSDNNQTYRRGDLMVSDNETQHKPVACPEMGCTCLVVTGAPVRLKGLASLLNPFLRF